MITRSPYEYEPKWRMSNVRHTSLRRRIIPLARQRCATTNGITAFAGLLWHSFECIQRPHDTSLLHGGVRVQKSAAVKKGEGGDDTATRSPRGKLLGTGVGYRNGAVFGRWITKRRVLHIKKRSPSTPVQKAGKDTHLSATP